MAGPTLEQQHAAAQLKANRLRTLLSESRRAADARRKIVVGGTVLLAMEGDPDLRGKVLHLLRENVTRPLDRAVIANLLGEPVTTAPHDAPPNGMESPPVAGV